MSPRGRVAALEASNDLIFDGDELEGDLALSDIEGDVDAVPPPVRPPEDDLDDETDYARSRLYQQLQKLFDNNLTSTK